LDPLTESDRTADVLIVDGQIEAIADQIDTNPPDADVYDPAGLVLGPGLVDLYSHSGEPGFESRETLASLTQAAIAGGFTRLTLLPDTQPAIDTPASVEWLHARLAQLPPDSVQVSCWGALTQGGAGEQMTEVVDLAASGVVGFADAQALQNWGLVRRLLEYLQPLGKPIALWSCDRALAGDGVIREGIASVQLGLPGNPAISETAALVALIECVESIGTPVHLMRISTARSVELIRSAKGRGVPMTASTTWMHLLRNSHDVKSYNPNLRLDPPLGNPADQKALIQGLQDGTLDAIAIDHTPHTYEEKMVPFTATPPGTIGLELALPLLWETFVASGKWSAVSLWGCLSTRPASCLGRSLPALRRGEPAEMTLFDPQQSWAVTAQSLCSRSTNTPWFGQQIRGKVVKTWGGPPGSAFRRDVRHVV
jgi:dihydroorotase